MGKKNREKCIETCIYCHGKHGEPYYLVRCPASKHMQRSEKLAHNRCRGVRSYNTVRTDYRDGVIRGPSSFKVQ
jgi:hypothetical protein